VNDGGEDAPMGPRDVRFFEILFAAIGVVFIALIIIAVLE